MIDFSVIIPVFNSQSCLQETVLSVINELEKIKKTYEIILIDDGSVDSSWEIIKQLKSKNNNIIGVRLTKNYGQHNALLCGLNLSNGDYIITIDDDLEQQPQDILKLYEQLTSGDFEMVYGMPINQKKSIFRIFFTYLYKRAMRTENKSAGEGSAFRILTKKLKEDLIKHSGSLFFLDEIALWYTDKIGYAKVEFEKSKKINSNYGYPALFTLSLRVLSLSSTMPLRVLRVMGFYIYGFSVLLALFFIFRKLVFKVPMGYTSLMVTILFSTGIITLSLGIIGEYLGNLIALANNKPSYSVKEKV